MIYIWIHLHKNELNKKYKTKNHILRQKLQISISN